MTDQPRSLPQPSGFNRTMGMKLTRWEEGLAELTVQIADEHLNGAGAVHGGVVASLLDNAVTFSTIYSRDPSRPRRCVTLSLSCTFVGQARSGAVLTATGRLRGGGRKIKFAVAEIRDQDGALVALADASLRLRGDSEDAAPTST